MAIKARTLEGSGFYRLTSRVQYGLETQFLDKILADSGMKSRFYGIARAGEALSV